MTLDSRPGGRFIIDSIFSYVESYLVQRLNHKWPRKLKGEMSWYFRGVLLMCPADEKFDYRLAAITELIRRPIYIIETLSPRAAGLVCSARRRTVWITRDVLLDAFGKKRNWKKIWPWCGSAYIYHGDRAKYRFHPDCSILCTYI